MLWGGEGTPLEPQGEDSLEAFPPLPAPADGELKMKQNRYYDRLFLKRLKLKDGTKPLENEKKLTFFESLGI